MFIAYCQYTQLIVSAAPFFFLSSFQYRFYLFTLLLHLSDIYFLSNKARGIEPAYSYWIKYFSHLEVFSIKFLNTNNLSHLFFTLDSAKNRVGKPWNTQ